MVAAQESSGNRQREDKASRCKRQAAARDKALPETRQAAATHGNLPAHISYSVTVLPTTVLRVK